MMKKNPNLLTSHWETFWIVTFLIYLVNLECSHVFHTEVFFLWFRLSFYPVWFRNATLESCKSIRLLHTRYNRRGHLHNAVNLLFLVRSELYKISRNCSKNACLSVPVSSTWSPTFLWSRLGQVQGTRARPPGQTARGEPTPSQPSHLKQAPVLAVDYRRRVWQIPGFWNGGRQNTQEGNMEAVSEKLSVSSLVVKLCW